jgi:hypothetical protein
MLSQSTPDHVKESISKFLAKLERLDTGSALPQNRLAAKHNEKDRRY